MKSSVIVGAPDWQKQHLGANLRTGGHDGRHLEMMSEVNPLYRGYEGVTARVIPVIVIDPREELAPLTA